MSRPRRVLYPAAVHPNQESPRLCTLHGRGHALGSKACVMADETKDSIRAQRDELLEALRVIELQAAEMGGAWASGWARMIRRRFPTS